MLEVINCEGPEDGNQQEWWGSIVGVGGGLMAGWGISTLGAIMNLSIMIHYVIIQY